MSFFKQLALLALTVGVGLNLTACQPGDSKAKKQPSLVSIAVSPESATVMLSSTQALKVMGSFSNSSSMDVTSASSFSVTASEPAGVALVGKSGVVTAAKAGTATITATYTQGSTNITKTATATITVPAAVLVSIAVTPTAPTVAPGATQPLTVTGTYSEGSKAVIATGLTFVSSNPSAATVGADGVVAGVAAGTSTITTTETISGKSTTTLVTVSAGGGGGCGTTAPTCAPATTIPADNVMIYSDAAAVPNFNPHPDWGQNPPVTFSEPTIASNKSLQYGWAGPGGLYEGLDWSANPVDVSTRGKLHLDFWTPDLTSVKVSIISAGKENAVTQVLTTGSWNSVDIDLSNYTVPDLTAIIQIKLEPGTAGTLYVDNIYFWGGGAVSCGTTVPTCAPTTVIPADSVTIYSDAATVANFNPHPDWGQNPPVTFSEPTIASNKSLQYGWAGPGGLYEGLDWSANPVDVSTRGKLHLDFWTPDLTSVKVSIISAGKENAVTQVLTTGSWNSVDIDLSNYTVPDLTAIIQIKLEPGTAGTLYVDNIYFWGGGAVSCGTTAPTCAPTTVIPADSVTIYSDAATVANFNPHPDWGQNPPVTFSEPTIASNKSLQYGWAGPGGLYEGLDWSANPVDVSAKGKLHLDFWSPDITSVKVSIIGGGGENAVSVTVTPGSWNAIDIDLSNYTVPDLTAIIQIKLEPGTARHAVRRQYLLLGYSGRRWCGALKWDVPGRSRFPSQRSMTRSASSRWVTHFCPGLHRRARRPRQPCRVDGSDDHRRGERREHRLLVDDPLMSSFGPEE